MEKETMRRKAIELARSNPTMRFESDGVEKHNILGMRSANELLVESRSGAKIVRIPDYIDDEVLSVLFNAFYNGYLKDCILRLWSEKSIMQMYIEEPSIDKKEVGELSSVILRFDSGLYSSIPSEGLSEYVTDKLRQAHGIHSGKVLYYATLCPDGTFCISEEDLSKLMPAGYVCKAIREGMTEDNEAFSKIQDAANKISDDNMRKKFRKSSNFIKLAKVVRIGGEADSLELIADNVMVGFAGDILKGLKAANIDIIPVDIYTPIRTASNRSTKKIVGVDNFNRDEHSDCLIADLVVDEYCAVIYKILTDRTTEMSSIFPTLVENDHELYTWEP